MPIDKLNNVYSIPPVTQDQKTIMNQRRKQKKHSEDNKKEEKEKQDNKDHKIDIRV